MARKAFMDGLKGTAIASAAVMIGIAILVMVSLRRVSSAAEPSSAGDER
jgi:hypothetical protein